jgi:hypothetical protein
MHYKFSENNTELGLRSNLGVPTGYQIMLNLGVKTNTRTDFISDGLKSFSVSVGVSVILILRLKPYLSVGVKPGVMQTPTKHRLCNEIKLKPSITQTPSIYFNFGLMKGFSGPSIHQILKLTLK